MLPPQEDFPMIKRLSALLLALLITLSLTGCDSLISNPDSPQTVNRTYKLAEATSDPDAPSQKEQGAMRTHATLYYPDTDRKYLVSRELFSLSLQDQALDVKLIQKLIDVGVLDSRVALKSLSFSLSEDKSTELVLLDFNKRFQNQVTVCATLEEEQLLVGSVVDTFLSAYDRTGAKLTVNGKQLYSSFEEISYRDPVSWYPTSIIGIVHSKVAQQQEERKGIPEHT